jgi:hypothetical protein
MSRVLKGRINLEHRANPMSTAMAAVVPTMANSLLRISFLHLFRWMMDRS